ncbi:hypothetical protein TcCL_Unassigned03237 [Trypanosoma cruzi]|nr:hypothetical protein TcCL_Unassigned03237 [Trypanosoma cruzi]
MSRDNSSQPLQYAARHSVNGPTVLAVVWCPPAGIIRSPTSVIGFDSTKKQPSTSGRFVAHGLCSTPYFILRIVFSYSLGSKPSSPLGCNSGPTTKRRALLDVLLAAQTP